MRRPQRPVLLAVGGLLLILGLIALGATIWVATLLARSLSEAGEAPAQAGSSATAASPGQVAIQPPPLLPTWTPRPAIPTPPPRPTSAVDIDGLLNAMSLEEKVGQMIMTGIPGRAFDAQTAQLIETYHFGSVVYFAENTANPGQTRRLSQELQRAAAGAAHGIPLLIAIDHEGGRVHRFGQGLTHFANPMALGAAASPELAYQAAAAAARELLAVGINVSLAPVLDINDEPLNPVIGVRAFGGSPDLVTLMGMAYLRGLQDQGVIAAAKHFPGHGSTIEDSHFTLPIVNKTEAQLAQNELLPFQAAIRNQVGVIQVAHVAYPQLDPSGAPASLSPLLVQGRLRGELGFDGVVMTDAMSMGAITNRYSVEQAAQLAALAGNDLLAYPQAEMAIAAYQAILAGARDGTIPQSRIEEAARRVLRLKQRYDLFANAAPPALETHEALAREIARRGIVFSGQGRAPLVGAGRLLLVTPGELPPGSATGDNLSLLGELLQGRGIEVEEWIYSVEDAGQVAAIQAQVQQALPGFPQAVLVLWDAALRQGGQGNQAQVNLLEALLGGGAPLVVVAASSPYDLNLLPAEQPALATFGGLPEQVEALAEALLAETLPTGRMPVKLDR